MTETINPVEIAEQKAKLATIKNQETAHLLPLELLGKPQGPKLIEGEKLLDNSVFELTETVKVGEDSVELPMLVAFNVTSKSPVVTLTAKAFSKKEWNEDPLKVISYPRVAESEFYETTPVAQKTVDSVSLLAEKLVSKRAELESKKFSKGSQDYLRTYEVDVKCSVHFNHQFPAWARDIAQAALNNSRYSEVCALCDVSGSWEVKVDADIDPKPFQKPDPLIIAKIADSDHWVVLARFDLERMEKVALDEYTVEN